MLVTWSVYCSGLKSSAVTNILALNASVVFIKQLVTPKYMKGKNSLYLCADSFPAKVSSNSAPSYYYNGTTKNPWFVKW